MGSLTDHIHIYVGASFKESGYSGLGGALYNSHGVLFSEPLESSFLEKVNMKHQKNVI